MAKLTPLVLTDPRIPAAVREAVATGLTQELARIADLPRGEPWRAGPCHGDLHLSHLLRRERADGSWELCIIDLSTPPSDPADPATAQSPWQDLAALRRGLEIFTADEFSDQAAEHLGMDPEDTCRTALLQAAGTRPDTPGWTPRKLAELERLRSAARTWADRAGGLLSGDDPELAGHPAWRLFRLRRLIHELDYAYAHDRAYHAAINLRHAVEASGLPASREGRTPLVHIIETYFECGGFDHRFLQGGISVYLWNLSRAFADQGHRVSVVTPAHGRLDDLRNSYDLERLDYEDTYELPLVLDRTPGASASEPKRTSR